MINRILLSFKYSIYLSISWFFMQRGDVSSEANLIEQRPQMESINKNMVTYSSPDDIVKGLENMVKQLSGTSQRTTLIAVNENEIEKGAIDKNPAILVPEPDNRPTQLVYDAEEEVPTVLMGEQDLPSRTLLLAEPTEPQPTVLFREPEYKKASVLYMDPENDYPPDVREKIRRKKVTRLIMEPEEPHTKATICSEPIEQPKAEEESIDPNKKKSVSEKTSSKKDSEDDDQTTVGLKSKKSSGKEEEESEKKQGSGMDEFKKLFSGISLS